MQLKVARKIGKQVASSGRLRSRWLMHTDGYVGAGSGARTSTQPHSPNVSALLSENNKIKRDE